MATCSRWQGCKCSCRVGILFRGVATSDLGVRHAVSACEVISCLNCFAVLAVPGVRDPERVENFVSTLALAFNDGGGAVEAASAS